VKEANLKRLLRVSNYMTFLKRLNYGDNKTISDCQGLGLGGGINKQNREDFVEANPIMWGTCHYTSFSSLQSTTPKTNCNANYGLWVLFQHTTLRCANEGSFTIINVPSGTEH
jgi:hypothetical protein